MVEGGNPPQPSDIPARKVLPPVVDPGEAKEPVDTFDSSDWRKATCLEDLWRFTTGEAAFCPGSKYIIFRTYHGDLYAESCTKFWGWDCKYLYQDGRNPLHSGCKIAIKFNESNGHFNFICKNGYYINITTSKRLICGGGYATDNIWGQWDVYLADKKQYDEVLKDYYMRIKHPQENTWWIAYKGAHSWCVYADKYSPDSWSNFYPWKTAANKEDWESKDNKVCLGHLSNTGSGSGSSTLEVDQTVGRSKSESESFSVSANVEFSVGKEFGAGFSTSVTSSVGCDWSKVSTSAYEVSQTTKVSTEVQKGEHKGIYQVHGMWGPFTMHAEEWSVEDYQDE